MPEKRLQFGDETRTYALIAFGIDEEREYVNFVDAVTNLGLYTDQRFIEHLRGIVDGFETCKNDMKKCKQWKGAFNTDYPSKVKGEIESECLQIVRKFQPFDKENFIDKIKEKMR